jgi:hypothetical protein
MQDQLRRLAAIFTQQLGGAGLGAAPLETGWAAASSAARTAPAQRAPQSAPPAAAAAPALGPDDLMKMMLMTMLSKELKGQPKRGTGGGFFEDEEETVGQAEQDRTTKAFARYSAYKAATKTRPGRVLELYREQVKEELNIRAGDRWSFRDWWKTMPFNKFRSVGRLGYLLSEMLDTADDASKTESERLYLLQAGLVQALKSCHQYALDGGDWKAAWPLTQVKDPYRPTAFGGSETELNLVAALLKAEADLQTRVRGHRYAEGGHDGHDELPGASGSQDRPKDAKGQGKRGKWKEAAAGAGGGGPAATPK